jgi:hypothetical protein
MSQIALHPSEPLSTNHILATITFCNLPQITNKEEAYIFITPFNSNMYTAPMYNIQLQVDK